MIAPKWEKPSRQSIPRQPHRHKNKLTSFLFKSSGMCNINEYTDQSEDYFEKHYRERVLQNLAQRVEKNGHAILRMETNRLKNSIEN